METSGGLYERGNKTNDFQKRRQIFWQAYIASVISSIIVLFTKTNYFPYVFRAGRNYRAV
jgi:hypothetical protein